MDSNKNSVIHTQEYGERDALRTAMAVWMQTTEANAETALEALLTDRDEKIRRQWKKILDLYRRRLAKIPVDQRQRIIQEAAVEFRRIFLKRMEAERVFQHPAVKASRMIRFACLFYSREYVAHRFVPILSDYHLEYPAARARGAWHAFRARVTYWFRFASAMRLDVALTILDRVVRLWDLLK